MLAGREVADMSKVIVLVRHTDNDGDVLTAQGVTAALELGRALAGDIDVAVSTGAQRATQTVACMLAGMGRHVPGGAIVVPQLRSTVEDRWREAYRTSGGGTRMADFRRVAPSLVAEDSAMLADGLRRVLRLLDDGQRALVVGHSPTNEAAVLGLTGTDIEPLGTGEGVELTVEDDTTTITRM
jgi:broad specificity phosphatase PhoE